MAITVLDGKRFADMIFYGANHLSANAKYVDTLNVFPVPDGDTGTNMNLSMTSGAKEVNNNPNEHIGKVGIALSKGLLMGARGNSGVILSQLFRGFAKSVESKASLTASEFAHAFEAGVETAYKAVMKPVEGTILTVAKDAAKKGIQTAKTTDDIVLIMNEIVKEAKASLSRTPELLPVLKEVGVVDSGGQGLVFVYEGFLAQLKGEKLPETSTSVPSMDELVSAEHHKSAQSFMNTEDIVFGYCTEIMVRLSDQKKASFSEEKFRQDISQFGDSLLVISDDELVKVHIHSEKPGAVLNFGQQYGELVKMKIENMREQHTHILQENQEVPTKPESTERQEYGIVTVSMGSGIADLFKSIGAHAIIEGGQTMNPSTEDIVKAIKQVHAKKIILLPNNKNIIMAAEQAAGVSEEEVIVIPSKTVPQGLAALLSFNPAQDLETNRKTMSESLQHVKTGQITYAVRDTNIDGLSIAKGDFMGISDGKIVVKDKDRTTTATKLLAEMLNEDAEILTVLKGEDATDEDVEQIEQYVSDHFPDIEIETHNGKQPLYPFIFSIE
ncbi:DAK2 domain-containing protein [Bacillaceae bacterium Marseille-Q3522]|nr:DAK2 domain-containing protein [Bacillaceae bacterium Marseille-Q3522]